MAPVPSRTEAFSCVQRLQLCAVIVLPGMGNLVMNHLIRGQSQLHCKGSVHMHVEP